ncbi:MAG TPA: DUF5723 family protein [Prolixibacteraceae bacterium]|nr:DUF5723 family protein [Prolixibacteraceae bacterium]
MKPGMSNKGMVILLALLSVTILSGKAQSNLVFYHIHDQFNSSDYNPAFLTSQHNFTFSIFPLSGMNVGYNNQIVVNRMLKNILLGDTIENVLNDKLDKFVEGGSFYQRFESSLLHLGYNSEFGSFNFRIKEVEQIMSVVEGSFYEFIRNPEFLTPVINQPHSFPANAAYYREYSLGYAKEIIRNKLTVGFRAKLYFGKISAIADVQGELVNDGDLSTLITSGSMYLSAPVKLVQEDGFITGAIQPENFSPVNFMLNSKNVGTGIDLGFNYKINHRLAVSASAVDLFGKISWKNNLNTLTYNGSVDVSGYVTSPDGIVTKNPGISSDDIENISDLFKIDHIDTISSYISSLPTTFYAGLKYQLNPKLAIGVVDRYISIKGMNHNSFSLTAGYIVNKKLSISSGYSIIGNSYFNVPFGILYKWDLGQCYVGTDNFFSLLLPSISDFSGITFGTCFYLFSRKSKYKKQLEYLPFFKEKKPRSATKKGLIFNSYPDS